ncbi:MAG: hypothetical protein MUW57_08440 [Pseudomonas sp.]|nr:hypothetical protein [Pseudomonas sp.]
MKNLAGPAAVNAANTPVGSGTSFIGMSIFTNGFEVTQIMPALKNKGARP